MPDCSFPQPLREVPHDDVVVAVPDEECRVLAEQVVEEARRPRFREIRATKVARREYEVGELVAKTAVKMDNAFEVVPSRQCRCSIDVRRDGKGLGGSRLEVTIIIRGNDANLVRLWK